MRLAETFMQELDVELPQTRAVLGRVPANKLAWRPHPTSMSIGELALHLASALGQVAEVLTLDQVDTPNFGNHPSPTSLDHVSKALDDSVLMVRNVLGKLSDEDLARPIRVVDGESTLVSFPRDGFARSILLNHHYHHRGQLCVYLRMLGVPVPAVYGASGDENPFGQA